VNWQKDAGAWRGRGEVLRAVNGAIILAARRKGPAQFYASEDALFATDAANKLDNSVHAARHVHRVADVNILSVCHVARRGRCAAGECAK